jgi:hypothetical protein
MSSDVRLVADMYVGCSSEVLMSMLSGSVITWALLPARRIVPSRTERYEVKTQARRRDTVSAHAGSMHDSRSIGGAASIWDAGRG